ncbi:MAG: methyltransferase domain-containing protein [Dehalococcoidia bacterium]
MPEIASAKLSIRPERLPRGAHMRVLDVGCGDGRHIIEAAKRGCFTVGVDYDAAELRKARQRIGAHRVDLVAADASHLPFRDAAFDAVICTETLEHLPDDAGAIAEIARAMRDGGTLHGAVPSHFTEIPFWKLSRGYYETPGGHVRIYAPKVLFRRLCDAGLAVTDFRYVHFVDSLFWLRFCLVDFVRPTKPKSDFEAAVLIAVAAERRVPAWRRHLREAMRTSRFIAAIDGAGALIWPKSLTFVARKQAMSQLPSTDTARARSTVRSL